MKPTPSNSKERDNRAFKVLIHDPWRLKVYPPSSLLALPFVCLPAYLPLLACGGNIARDGGGGGEGEHAKRSVN